MMETLQKELELLQRQKAASAQSALMAKQRQNSGGMWTRITGTPPSPKVDDFNDNGSSVIFEIKPKCHIRKKFIKRFHSHITVLLEECGHIDNKLEKLAVQASVEMTPAVSCSLGG
ncbi:hypothetical protein NL676_030583 [Syzygium grande]|nr:hypothetical protein NL676_030583 [Syzygium grande]